MASFPGALILDFYRTLTTCPYERLRDLATELGMPTDTLVEAMIPGRDGKGERWMELEIGHLPPEQFWEEACAFAYERSGVRADPCRVMREFVSVEVPDEVLVALEHLRARNFPVCIITNGFRPADGILAPLDRLASLVTAVVESFRTGMRKPDPAIFDLALRLLNCSRRDALFIDDTSWFVLQARNQGLRSICVSGVEDTITLLSMLV